MLHPASEEAVKRAEAREQVYIKIRASYFRCFNTISGKLVLKDLKAQMPSKISASDPYATTRNAAVRDLLDYIERMITDGKDPEEIPMAVSANEATMREAS